MGSSLALKNTQDQEFRITHPDNAGAININSNDIVTKSVASVTDNAIARFVGTTGKLQNSTTTIDDGGNVGSGTQSFNGFGGSGFKNHIINGNFDVWQRGTNFNNLTNGTYSADKWAIFDAVGDITYNIIRNAGVFTGGYGGTYTFNSGTGFRSVVQFIENVTKFKIGSKVTISFEAYTNSTPYTVGVTIQGVKNRWAASTGAVTSYINLTNTKTRYSVTLTVPDWASLEIDWAHLENTALACKFDLPAITNGKDFIIGNVQLEEGSIATPFENRPFGLELMLCKRYYRKSFAYETVPANGSSSTLLTDVDNAIISLAPHRSTLTNNGVPHTLAFDVEMRDIPTVHRYGNANGFWFYRDLNGEAFVTDLYIFGNKQGLNVKNEYSITYNGIALGHYVADAEL